MFDYDSELTMFEYDGVANYTVLDLDGLSPLDCNKVAPNPQLFTEDGKVTPKGEFDVALAALDAFFKKCASIKGKEESALGPDNWDKGVVKEIYAQDKSGDYASDPTGSSTTQMQGYTITGATKTASGGIVTKDEVWRVTSEARGWEKGHRGFEAKEEFDIEKFSSMTMYTGGEKCYRGWDDFPWPPKTQKFAGKTNIQGPFHYGWCCSVGCGQCFLKSRPMKTDWQTTPNDPACTCLTGAEKDALWQNCRGATEESYDPDQCAALVSWTDEHENCKEKYQSEARFCEAMKQAHACQGDDIDGIPRKPKEIPCHKVWRRTMIRAGGGVTWVRLVLGAEIQWLGMAPKKIAKMRKSAKLKMLGGGSAPTKLKRDPKTICDAKKRDFGGGPTKYGMGFCFSDGQGHGGASQFKGPQSYKAAGCWTDTFPR